MQQSMTILLTTHSMEEADVLCSRISILTSDGLQCFGSQVHLKNKYGKWGWARGVSRRGFLLSFAFCSAVTDEQAYMKTQIDAHLEFVEKKLDMSVYKVDKVREGKLVHVQNEVDLGVILGKITRLQANGVITKWSVCQSSLDDVFLRLCKEHERDCVVCCTTKTAFWPRSRFGWRRE